MEGACGGGSLYQVAHPSLDFHQYQTSFNYWGFFLFWLLGRVACWTFLADGFLTVCFKNHPQLTILEMDCDFPWSTELFEAESVSSFNEMAAAQTTGPSLPTLRKVAESLLQMPSSGNRISWDRSLSVEHLLMLIYGTNG